MNHIMLLLPLLLLINVNSYEDCMYVEKEYKIKNDEYIHDGPFADWKWVDDIGKENFTFIAQNADDCKSRTLRNYEYRGMFYDNKVNDKYKETFYTHCCFFSYDEMEKYEDPNEIEKEKDAITFTSTDDYYRRSSLIYEREEKVTKKEEITGKCIALTDNQYENIKEFILHAKYQTGRYINLKIDCSTSYLQFFMITLMLLFLL